MKAITLIHQLSSIKQSSSFVCHKKIKKRYMNQTYKNLELIKPLEV